MNKRLPELPASVSQKEVKTRQSSGKSPLKPKLSRTSTKSITSVHGGGRPRNHDERVQTITEGTNQVEMKRIIEENTQLRKELASIQELYNQLLREGSGENYEERRVYMLKSQIIQLERQIMLDVEALSKRSAVILEVENTIERISEQFRELLRSETPGPMVTVERSQLTRLIEDTEGARRRLYKNVESSDAKHLVQPLLFMGEFVKPGYSDDSKVSLLNVCSGSTENLNLKHVAKLESKLFSLLKKLLILRDNLATTPSGISSTTLPSAAVLNDRSSSLVAAIIPELTESCQSLMELSLLVPAAPWPTLKRTIHPAITTESVMSSLPSFPRSKQKQAQSVIDALLKANNYSREVAKLEYRACSEELKFHQDVYELQIEYTHAIFDALKEAYQVFENDMRESICMPFLDILSKFNALKETSSEEALKSFLSSFKEQSKELQGYLESLQSVGSEGLSAYCKEFFKRVESLIAKHSKKRKQLLKEVDEAKGLADLQLSNVLDIVNPNDVNIGST